MADLYSFEFFKRQKDGTVGQRIGEYFLLNGPLSYKEGYKYRISVEPVFGGGAAVTDFGNDQGTLSLQGEFHIYYKGRPPEKTDPFSPGSALNTFNAGQPGAALTSSVSAAKESFTNYVKDSVASFFPIAGANVRSGAMEFQDFIGLLYGIRSDQGYTSLDTQGKLISLEFVEGKFNFTDYCLVYNDYGRSRSVEVVFQREGVSISRSVDDTNTYKWQLDLIVIRDRHDVTRQQIPEVLDQILGLNPYAVMNGITSLFDSMIRFPLKITDVALRMSGYFKRFTQLGGDLSDSFKQMKKQFNEDGKLARTTFQSGVNNVKSQLGFQPKKNMWDRVVNQANQNKKLLKDASEAEYNLRYKLGNFIANIEDGLYNLGGFLVANAPGQSLEGGAVQPGADYTAWFTHPLYELFLDAYSNGVSMSANMVKAATDTNFSVYQASGGDTFESLAANKLGDPSLAGALAAYNGKPLTAGITGLSIKLPTARKLAIYAKMGTVVLAKDLERALLGEDLALTATRDFQIAANGDLDVVEGEPAFLNNVIDIVDTQLGALPQYPWFGNPALLGELPDVIARSAYVQKLIQAIQADPRTLSAALDEVIQDGNVLTYLIKIQSIYGGPPFFLEALPPAS